MVDAVWHRTSLRGLDPLDVMHLDQIVALYGHLLDLRGWDRLAEVFTADVLYDASDLRMPVMQGLTEVRRHFEIAAHPTAHHTTNLLVSARDNGQEAELHSKYLLPRDDGTVASGDYFDIAVRTQSGWRIRYRRATLRRQRQLPSTSRRASS